MELTDNNPFQVLPGALVGEMLSRCSLLGANLSQSLHQLYTRSFRSFMKSSIF